MTLMERKENNESNLTIIDRSRTENKIYRMNNDVDSHRNAKKPTLIASISASVGNERWNLAGSWWNGRAFGDDFDEEDLTELLEAACLDSSDSWVRWKKSMEIGNTAVA
jgi:hypothetical protein